MKGENKIMARISKANQQRVINRKAIREQLVPETIPVLEKGKTLAESAVEQMERFKHTASSKKPKLDLIPYNALVALANRFELGQEKYGNRAWNALSSQ